MTTYHLVESYGQTNYIVDLRVTQALLAQLINYQGNHPQGTKGYELQTLLKGVMIPKQR